MTPARSAVSLALSAAVLVAAASAPEDGADPRIAALLDEVSEARLRSAVERLVAFETRHTLSAADSPARGIGAARQWLLDELRAASPRLQVSFDTHQVPGGQVDRIPRDAELRNVVAILPGRSPRRLYVTGHYDSLARPASAAPPARGAAGGFDWTRGDNPAPGANDDGSGTALTLELARVFAASGLEFEATLVFACFAGEEQGLVGARLHAQKAAAERWPVEAVLNNDIVGGSRGGDGRVDSGALRVFSEGPEDSPSRQLARFVRRQAALYLPAQRVRLVARHDRFGRGGDHTAFNQLGFAGVRLTEANENFARQHTVEDTLEGVDFAYLARNAKVNAAALAVMALAPAPPVVVDDRGRPLLDRQPSGYDARLRWKPSPGAVGYKVFWREAWTADWQHERGAGAAGELVLAGVSIDDHVFGVAALGPGGHESVVAAYVNPPRADQPIRAR